MSRIVAIVFIVVDFITTMMTLMSCQLTAIMVAGAAATSLMLAMCASTVRALFWPAYFWETGVDAEPVKKRSGARQR